MIRNITRTTPPTEQKLAERQAWFEEQMAEADRVNAAAMIAGQQQRDFEQQARLVEATRLELSQLLAIRIWLQANS
jgi:hypothetical protein